MCYTGLFKRIIPFALTFAAGLFIASFFVSIAFPTVKPWRKNRTSQERQMRIEMDELREKVRTLRKENEELRRNASDSDRILQEAVPPVELEALHPPPPPKRPKQPRYDSLQ